MQQNDLIVRLARACAHGTRQMEFVNELLAGEAYCRLVPIPFYGPQGLAVQYGDSRMGGQSWVSLKKRLVNNGFMVKMGPWEDNRRTVDLRFSV